ncbi:MAG TPA: hypothetical protein PLF22_10765 [Pseudomonadales bacterium]|nr:hypothetical protein [Pseudomonadales bacterium]
MTLPLSNPAPSRFMQLAFAGCVLLYGVLVLIGFNDIEEDAFIYFRFAANIADGYGYVFNIGGERIESCSGPLWLLLVTLLSKLPINLVLSTKLLCFVLGVLCIRQVLLLSQRFVADRILAIFPALLMIVSIPFYTWSMRGLETASYWLVFLWLLEWVTNPARIRHWWLPAVCLVNSRPEGFFMLAAVVPYLFFFEKNNSRFWPNAIIVVSAMLAVLLWRFWYFHDLVPHPFYLKINSDHAHYARNLLVYGWYSGWPLLLLLALPGLLRGGRRADVALAGCLLLALLWNVFVFEDKVYNRHIGLSLPFFYMTTLMLVARWFPQSGIPHLLLRAVLSVLVVFTLLYSRYVHFDDSHPAPFINNAQRAVLQADEYWPELWRLVKNPDHYRESPDRVDVFSIRYSLIAAVGDFVKLNYRDDAVVVYDQIGQAPWYAGRNTFFIDNIGLGYRELGFARFHEFAENSWLYSSFENVRESMLRYFWPTEQRIFTDDQMIDRILEKNPVAIIARKGMINNGRVSFLSVMLKRADVAAHYQARYLLNNREIIFERMQARDDYRRHVDDVFVVPEGSRVQKITAFSWCKDSICMDLE